MLFLFDIYGYFKSWELNVSVDFDISVISSEKPVFKLYLSRGHFWLIWINNVFCSTKSFFTWLGIKGRACMKCSLYFCPFLSCCSISDLNVGRLVRGDLSKGFVPPIAGAVLDLLGKHGEFLQQDGVGVFISTFRYCEQLSPPVLWCSFIRCHASSLWVCIFVGTLYGNLQHWSCMYVFVQPRQHECKPGFDDVGKMWKFVCGRQQMVHLLFCFVLCRVIESFSISSRTCFCFYLILWQYIISKQPAWLAPSLWGWLQPSRALPNTHVTLI